MCHNASVLNTNTISVLNGGRRTLDSRQFNASRKGWQQDPKRGFLEKFLFLHGPRQEGGERIFFSFFGNTLLNIGYHNVTPVYKKGQRPLGYKGLAFKSSVITYTRSAQSKLGKLDVTVIEIWMEKCYCEGEADNKIANDEIWCNFQTQYQINDEKRPTFFALFRKNVFGRPSFL